MERLRQILVLLFGWAVVACAVADAQVTTATLLGIVRDSTGSVLPGATITAMHEPTGVSRTATTDTNGEFVLTALPNGPYSVKVELQGFRTHTSRGIQLGSGQTVKQTFDLQIGEMAETVTVQAELSLLKTATSEQMETLGALQVRELPLSRRNITGLLRLAPGVDPTGGHRGVRFNGVGKHGAGITVDGTDANSNPEGRGISQYGGENYIDIMSIEAVQEVQLVKGVLPAEYGGVVGGQVNLISRSGTNAFHGSLFENYQGQALNARDIFLPRTLPKPRTVFNQFGGSLGGPVLRNKAFFFGTYEGYRESAFVRVQGNVPTQALRDQIMAALPFPETTIVLDTMPLPTEPRNADIGLFVGARNRERDENHVLAKGEMAVLNGGLVSVTYTRMRPSALIPRINTGGANDREFRHKQDRIATTFTMTRRAWVSESRFGWNKSDMERLDLFFLVQNPKGPERTVWGGRMGQLNISGLFSTPSTETWDMEGTTYSFDQKLSRATGSHLFKAGFRVVRQTGSRSNPENPVFRYANKADLLANIPTEVRPTFGAPPHESHMDEFGGFVQDDWRVGSRLVLNLGLRYDYYGTVKLRPTTDVPVQIVNLNPPSDLRKMDFGSVRDPLDPYEPDGWVNLGPRAGFAWTLDGTSETVVRGGVGVLFSPHMPGMIRQGAAHPIVPFRQSWTRTEALALGLRWPSYNDDLRQVVERLSAGRPFVFSIVDPDIQNPYTVQSMINVQRAFGRLFMAEAGYVRVDGRKFIQQRLFNLAFDRVTGARPNPALGAPGGYFVDNGQTSEYNALQTSVRKRFSSHFSFDVHYTLSKGMATQGGDVGAYYQGDFEDITQDFYDPEFDRGPVVSDARHRLSADLIYEVPWFRNSGHALLRHTIGGWEVAGIFTSRSGERLLITQPSGIPNSRPDLVSGVNPILSNWRETRMYLDRNAFALVPTSPVTRATLRPGNLKPGDIRGPGTWNVDVTLAKNIPFGTNRRLQIRADMFNALNHVNYSGPETSITNAFFGQIRSAGSPRTIQVGARLTF